MVLQNVEDSVDEVIAFDLFLCLGNDLYIDFVVAAISKLAAYEVP